MTMIDDAPRVTSIPFAELGLPPRILQRLQSQGMSDSFPIQAAVIPDALAGRDVAGRAPTGSGKTLGFGLPLVARLTDAKPKRPVALVLAPTRELAEQIMAEIAPLRQGRRPRGRRHLRRRRLRPAEACARPGRRSRRRLPRPLGGPPPDACPRPA